MYCPKCGAEYRDGFSVCSECKVDLVAGSPPEEEHIDATFKEVLHTFNTGDIAFIKSLLESEGIEYFFQGENFMSVRPLLEPVRLMVREDQSQRAYDLLKGADLAFKAISVEKTEIEDSPEDFPETSTEPSETKDNA
ncbi:MAG: DUF2007 domain-containing protein [Myxococcales bacterium]|nr:DUF2007 domain-containing protein [Myxococcales bacterium]MCB9643508.1 DUF2007 domain-containing protein [Myxococcales bacterium]